MPKVYIAGKIQDNGVELLKRKGFKVDLNLTGKNLTREELKDIFSNYDALVTMPANKVDGELLFTASKNLKVIANYAVGFDNIDTLGINCILNYFKGLWHLSSAHFSYISQLRQG